MDAPELSVYGEAKGEYTRQLCVFLIPSLETYFLDLLEEARTQSTTPQKLLWNFQGILQSIPDWNQDKVIRETEKIQKDCKCDYLDELLTAVFIAHAKVLSAIRMNSRNKDFHITIPRIDHFLHRVLSDCARSLWTNAFLFADTNPVDKQKNLRQVSALLQEAVLQAIRGLLPVKNILRQYLKKEDDEEEEETKPIQEVQETISSELQQNEELSSLETKEEVKEEIQKEEIKEEVKEEIHNEEVSINRSVFEEKEEEIQKDEDKTVEQVQEPPTIVVQTKPTVSFTQNHVFFDSDSLDANQIHDVPFAEAELREEEEEEEEEEIDTLHITDEELPMDAEEIIF